MDGTVRLWNFSAGVQITQLVVNLPKSPRCLKFFSCGNLLASTTMNDQIGTWHTESGSWFKTVGSSKDDKIWAMQYSPDGKLLVSDSHRHSQSGDRRQSEGEVDIWDSESWRCVETFDQFQCLHEGLAFIGRRHDSALRQSSYRVWHYTTP